MTSNPIMEPAGVELRQSGIKDALLITLKNNIRQYTMIAALLIIWVTFAVLTKGTFISARNLSNLFLQMCTIAILTNGMVLVMVAGHIDLSVGTICGTLGALAAYLMSKAGVHPLLAICVTVVCGLLIGAWHGFWIAYRGVPAFIVTLSSMTAFKGITLAITNGATIGEFSDAFKAIGQGFLPRLFLPDAPYHDLTVLLGILMIGLFLASEVRKRNARISKGFAVLPASLHITKMVIICATIAILTMVLASYRGFPYAMLLLFVIVFIFSTITTRSRFGRYVYAIGGNKEAARMSGINIKQTNFIIYVLMGLLCSIASMVFTARLNAATTAAGNLFELDTIAACIIGGTSTMGGAGTVFGALVGALVMASLDNGMSLMNLPIMWQYMIKGMILLFAVWVDLSTKKK